MEHRWGIRQPLEVDVKLYMRPGHPVTGRLLNASSSGGYVATNATVPIMTRVHITLGWGSPQRGDRHRIAAYVVRSDARGIGLEWQEFAPAPVLALLDALDTSPARIRTITEAREEAAHIPWRRSDRTLGSAPDRG